MAGKIKEFVASRNFLLVILALFTVQCLWFAGSIKPVIPADEQFHHDFIALYATEPILSGPILSHQPSNSLYLGDVQQTPSFFYHYLMSFPLRLVDKLTSNTTLQYLSLRLIDVLIGIATLVLLRQIFRKAGFSDFITNLAIALFATTGMFLWVSSAISYDGLSMLCWFALLWALLRLQDRITWNNIMLVLSFALLTTIVKVTYAPVIIGVMCAFLVMNGKGLRLFADKQLPRHSRNKKIQTTTALLTLLFVILAAIAAARIGTNLVRYHSITPSCQTVHSVAACQASPMVERNDKVALSIKQFKQAGKIVPFTPVNFTGQWLDVMYQRMYYYFGMRSFGPSAGGELVLAMALILLAYLVVAKRSNLIETDKEFILFFAGAFYAIVLFLFHFHHYLTTGNQYGFQGRYLLPMMPIAYVFTLKLAQMVNRSLTPQKSKLLIAACLVVLVAFIYEDFPMLAFVKSTDANWYTPQTASINQKLHDDAYKIHLLTH